MDTATVAQTTLHWLWPSICAHCREDLPKEHPGPLCLGCRLLLTPNEPPCCLRCSEPLRPPRSHCQACSKRLHAARVIRSAFLYRGAAVSVVHAFKYRGRRSAARMAGSWMAAHLARFPELLGAQALVPVPLHPRRRRERGYNQALLLAESLSAAAGIPVADILARRKDTRPLWTLDKPRRQEVLSGAFWLPAPEKARGRRFLLIDDVCTSGASLEACAKALRDAGAAEALGYVFARQTAG